MLVLFVFIFYEVFLRIFISLFHSLVMARAHGILLTGPLPLKTPVNSDLLAVEPILVASAWFGVRKIDHVCPVGYFLLGELGRVIYFILYLVSLLILDVEHLTRYLSGHGGISFCFETDFSLLVDYLLHNTLDFTSLGVN